MYIAHIESAYYKFLVFFALLGKEPKEDDADAADGETPKAG